MASFARRRLRVVLVVAALLALLAPAALWLRDSSLVRVEHVTVTGLDGREAPAIRRALTAAALDMSTLHVRQDALMRATSSYSVVRGIRAEADFPHRLRLSVNAYEPVAALESASRRVAVARDGTVLRGTPLHGLAVIGVRTLPGGDRVTDAPALRAVALLGAAPPALRERVERVFRGRRGITATLDGGPKLCFGDGARLGAKWAAAAQVLASPGARGAGYVDVRLPERPAAGDLSGPELSTSTSG